MRLWITKNSEVPVREQITRQIVLGILSRDLVAGQKLPSTRALARRYKIHQNTVSAALHALSAEGWLEMRRGSGLYIRGIPRAAEKNDRTSWLQKVAAEAQSRGYRLEEVITGLQALVAAAKFTQVVIVEPDPAMGEILREELLAHVRCAVHVTVPAASPEQRQDTSLFVALPTRVPAARQSLADTATLLTLTLRSISGFLEAETMPSSEAVIAVASRSEEFRKTALALLLAVGIPSACLCEIDPALAGWKERSDASTIIIADIVAGQLVEGHSNRRLFRILSDDCLSELSAMTVCEGSH